MKTSLVAMVALFALLSACGSDDGGDDASSNDVAADPGTSSADSDPADGADGEDASGGAVVDPAPAGKATVSVDGRDITFEEVLFDSCAISDDAVTYGFAAADGVTTLAAGLNHMDGDWLGSIAVDVPNPDGEGVIGYYPAPAEGATLEKGSVAIDGSSMSYSGPMLMQPPNDGSNPPPVDVGTGTISATC